MNCLETKAKLFHHFFLLHTLSGLSFLSPTTLSKWKTRGKLCSSPKNEKAKKNFKQKWCMVVKASYVKRKKVPFCNSSCGWKRRERGARKHVDVYSSLVSGWHLVYASYMFVIFGFCPHHAHQHEIRKIMKIWASFSTLRGGREGSGKFSICQVAWCWVLWTWSPSKALVYSIFEKKTFYDGCSRSPHTFAIAATAAHP